MLQTLINLPYVHFWLPALAAVVFGFPMYWFARPGRSLAEPPPRKPEPGQDHDPFTAGSTTEQRKAFRRKGNPVEIICTPEEDTGHPEVGYVLDRSISGLRLMIPRKVPPGTLLSVRPSTEVTPWVQIEVRNCVPSTTQPDSFDVGCRFIKAPPYPVLLLFG